MSKILPDHLARQAFVYVRQSTQDQLLHNHESRRRQYSLADRARQLGWSDVVVIDDDLGRSGGGVARPGFERLLVAICEGRVGIVLAIEASRLARNGRDWHTLLEFCGLVGCLLADEDGVYDARLPNDRLLLGMKGTMSEMELSILRQRSFEALRQKAGRGELFLNVPVGYVRIGHDRIAMDPDLRVREGIGLVFRRFAAFQSVRQVHLWLRQEQIRLPAVEVIEPGRGIVWKLPVYSTLLRLLTNPIYGGAYAFGRTGNRVTVENGRKHVIRGVRRERADWAVLLPGHHEGYVSWAEFERNQRLIADNANACQRASDIGSPALPVLQVKPIVGHAGEVRHSQAILSNDGLKAVCCPGIIPQSTIGKLKGVWQFHVALFAILRRTMRAMAMWTSISPVCMRCS
ncbi:recombinase family protein [Roseomonas sp. NAR14]|uniref:Recombinase family protein n=1 Tax=Roseomonas acroporae TaxID=2937791 RepID=A0A9X2BXX1_9PROT|nr:recombinase family protein [Roseomonas acroporae]MCK8787736.1 recombinase family protein [Roseomonas acroporae]